MITTLSALMMDDRRCATMMTVLSFDNWSIARRINQLAQELEHKIPCAMLYMNLKYFYNRYSLLHQFQPVLHEATSDAIEYCSLNKLR